MTESFDILLDSLRMEDNEAKGKRLQKRCREDWGQVPETAAVYGVQSMLFHVLRPLKQDLDIPRETWEKIKVAHYHSLARNMYLYWELFRLVSLFNAEKIPVILLKGAHLAEFVYPNPALRPMVDVDLLVRRQDLAAAHLILTADGYFSQDLNLDKRLEHVSPYQKNGGLTVELHFNIFRPPLAHRFDVGELWDRACKVSFKGTDSLTLCPEDLMLHLINHASVHHVFSMGLIPFVDICRLLERYQEQFDWDTFWARADRWKMDRAVCVMLEMTDRLLGLPAPARVKQEMENSPQAVQAVNEGMVMLHETGQTSATPFVARLFNRQGRRISLRILPRLLFPSGDLMFEGKDSWSHKRGVQKYFLYMKRMQKLALRHGRVLWLRLRKDPETVSAIESHNRRNNLRDWMIRDDR